MYEMSATHDGRFYVGKGEGFNDAWQEIAAQLPRGRKDAVVDLDDDGCVGGSLRWDELCKAWVYHPWSISGVRVY